MVLPVQLLEGVPGEALADAELAYALGARGEGILWTFPPELEEALRRSPGLPARMRGLPVGMFLQAEVRRIGDPLYGDLRRLAALSGADVALLPIELRYDPEGAYRITAAILDVASGRVGWLGVLRGEPGSPGDPRALASVAEALALALLPLG